MKSEGSRRRRKNRVCFLVSGDLGTLTGGYIYDRKLLDYLVRHRSDKDEFALLRVPDTKKSLFDVFYNLWLVVALVPRRRFELIIEDGIVYRKTFLFNAICRFLLRRRRRRVRFVGIVHMIDSPLAKRPLERTVCAFAEKKWLASLDSMIVNSRATLAGVSNLSGGKARGNSMMIGYPGYYDGAGIEIKNPKGAEAIVGHNRGSSSNVTRILYAGQLIPRKGLHLLVDALSALRDLGWELYVVGDEGCDPEYALRIRKMIEAHNLGERVKLLGEIRHEEMGGIYASSDLFVSPSLYEAYGMSVLEAQVFRIPVIAFDVGGVGEIVETGVTGVLVAPGNVGELSGALRKLISNRELLSSMSDACSKRTARFHSWDETCGGIARNLDQILSENAP